MTQQTETDWELYAVRTRTKTKMAARLTLRVRPEAALWMTPTFRGQLASLWATWFFSTLPFVFVWHLRVVPPPNLPPIPGEQSGTTNPNSGYKLQTCLWRGSACSPLSELLQQTPLSPLEEQHDPNFTPSNLPFGRLQWVFLLLYKCCPQQSHSTLLSISMPHSTVYHFM